MRRPLCLALVAAAMGLVAGCASYTVESRTQWTSSAPSGWPLLVMTPPRFLMAVEPYQAYQWTYEVVAALSHEDIAVVAPWEYDPDGALMARPDADAELAAMLEQQSVGLVGATLVRLTVAEQSSDRAVLEPMMLGGDLAMSYESDVAIRLELLSIPDLRELAVVDLSLEDDLLDRNATAADPRPRLREALNEVAQRVANMIADRWSDGPRGGVPGCDLLYNPREMFSYQGTGGDTLDDTLADLDELDRLASSLIYYQYFEPELDGATLRRFQESPSGLLVSDPGELQGQLQAGDYIVGVRGAPILGPQSLTRVFLLADPGQPVEVAVVREGDELSVEVVVPEP